MTKQEKMYTTEEVLKLLDQQRANCWMEAKSSGTKDKDLLTAVLNAPTPKLK